MDKQLLTIVIILLGILVMLSMIVQNFFKNRNTRAKFYDKKDPLGNIDDSLIISTENDDFDVVSLGPVSDEELKETSDPIFNGAPQSQEQEQEQEQEQDDFAIRDPDKVVHVADELGIDDLEVSEFVESDPGPEAEAEAEEEEQDKVFELPNIIQIHVFALEYDGFNGVDLLRVFKQAKLEYGRLKIFERLDAQRRVDFAVASMVEPGTFPETEIETFRCPGVVFFLQPRVVDKPLAVFDEFIEAIDMVATKLDGVKLDHKRDPLTKTAIKQIRNSLGASTE